MIALKKVSKRFGEKVVLDQLSLEFSAEKIHFVLGKSGTGKSVLLKTIVGLLQPDEGELWVDEFRVDKMVENERASVRKLCGMVFQHPALFDSLNVFENIAFGIKALGLASNQKQIRSMVLEKLKLLDLDEGLLSRYPGELSFAIQKNVSLARTLATGPKYLLFDEPTTAQDPVTTARINELILKLSKELGVGCVVVSHDMPSALSIAEHIILLKEGQICDEGTPSQMKKSTVPLTQAFLEEGALWE